jgi:hypothetical protein
MYIRYCISRPLRHQGGALAACSMQLSWNPSSGRRGSSNINFAMSQDRRGYLSRRYGRSIQHSRSIINCMISTPGQQQHFGASIIQSKPWSAFPNQVLRSVQGVRCTVCRTQDQPPRLIIGVAPLDRLVVQESSSCGTHKSRCTFVTEKSF